MSAEWKLIVDQYAIPNSRRSMTQVCVTAGVLYGGLGIALLAVAQGWWWLLVLDVPLALVQVRLFVLFHDATHGSLFPRKSACDRVGVILGVACLTPYYQWRRRHALHHATSGDLDRRGWWEIPTLSVEEYVHAGLRQRLAYRLTRNPWLLFTVGAWAFFFILQRWPAPSAGRAERINLWGTNLALAGITVVAVALLGWVPIVTVWLPIALLSTSLGFWLFYVQHQFDEAYWRTADEWSFYDAAMKGSSLLLVPRALSWFFAGIGYHHIHHLNPRIPNYRLAATHDENPRFQDVHTLTLRTALACGRANLWNGSRMVSFREARTLQSLSSSR